MKIRDIIIYASVAMAGTLSMSAQAPEHHDSTFNALDYVLQRPAPAWQFEKKSMFDRLFITAEGGPTMMRSQQGIMGQSQDRIGFRLGLTAGDWVTPVHGWRVGLSFGRNSGMDNMKPYFGSFSADYMMNMSGLLRGDNPKRRFETIGTIGLEVEALHRNDHKLWAAGGLRLGLQQRAYLTNSTFIYIEPRIGIYTDGLDDVKTWQKYDWQASVMLGLGYRLNQNRGYRVIDNSLFISEMFRNNLFTGASFSLGALGNNTDFLKERIAPQFSVHVGKWFTASSGLRLQIGGGEMREYHHGQKIKRWDGIFDVDYMFNLTSAFNGYDPDRRAETNIVLGASMAHLSKGQRNVFPGLHAGIQGVLNLNQNVALYIEPQVRLYDKKLMNHGVNRASLYPSVAVGLIYNARGTQGYNNAIRLFEDSVYRAARHGFITLTGGMLQRTGRWTPSLAASLSFGSWVSPVSAWRAGFDAENYASKVPFRSAGVFADYMASLSSVAAGYDDSRFLDIRGFIGMGAGLGYYSRNQHHLVWGPRLGLQAAFRVNNDLDIILEPQALLLGIPHYRRAWNPEWRVMAGLSYKLPGKRETPAESILMRDPDDDGGNFISITAAPGAFSEGLTGGHVSWSFNGAFGGWLTNVSGLQAFIDYNFAHYTRANKDMKIGVFGVDYLCNITSILTGGPSKKFNLVGMAGPGIAWSNLGHDTVGMALHAGLQGRWNLTPSLELLAAPTATLVTKGIMENAPHPVIANFGLAVGFAYNL